MSSNKLENQVVFITGASSGLGEQIAYFSAKQNATLVITARSEELLSKVAKRCTSYTNNVVASFVMDVTDRQQVKEVISTVEQHYGKIDILVNNAGFGLFEEFIKFDLQVAEEMFQVNVLGLIHLTKLVACQMATKGSGHIINIASQGGKMATPKSTIYSATKFAVIGFSNALRLELKPHGIYVTTVNPGPIRTNFFKRADQSGDYLASVKSFALEPELVGKRIVQSMGKNKREINLPWFMELGSRLYCLFPKVGDYFSGTIFNRK